MYYEKYVSSLQDGINKVNTAIEGKKIDKNIFLDLIIQRTKKVDSDFGKIFFFGNGASAAFSNHMALDWSKNGEIQSMSLSDSSLLTALANDYSYEEAMVEFLKINKANENDIVVTTSSSGNSSNIANVIDFCNKNKIDTIGLSGLNLENYSSKNAKYSYFVDMKTYGMVECIHQIFLHIWLDNYMDINEWDKVESQNMDSNNFKL